MEDTVETKPTEKTKKEARFLGSDDIRSMINKSTGHKSAFDLSKENPADVPDWIPSGNRLLDSVICEGKLTGLPVGRITELAAEPSGGKSFLAVAFCKNAIQMGYEVVYFCSEPGGVEADFVQKVVGFDNLTHFTYVEVNFMEEIFATIETLLVNTNNRYLFVWDSYAATPSEAEAKGGFDPSSTFAIAPRVANLGLKKLMVPLAKRECTLLVLNQIRDNIGADKYKLMVEPYRIPGGKSMAHSYSLRLWLFANQAKGKAVVDENESKIGKTGRIFVKKSRYRTEGRECPMAFTWSGENPHLHNEELWLEALKDRSIILRNKITYKDGTSEKCPGENPAWTEWINDFSQPERRKKVEELIDQTFIYNYETIINIPKVAEDDDQ